MTEFVSFPKISRWFKDVVVTEKIDGTNAQVIVTDDGRVTAASRNRLITPGDDNHGFAAWVQQNADALKGLGPGRHYGEWWGQGIQRGYGRRDRAFSLFNVGRWARNYFSNTDGKDVPPACCDVVPILYQGPLERMNIAQIMSDLRRHGSDAYPFMDPEGIVIFHTAAQTLFKVTFDGPDKERSEHDFMPTVAA